MRWQLLPDDPFENVSPNPNLVIHPMRGCTENVRLAAQISANTVDELEAMKVGDELPTIHGRIRRID